MSENSKKVLVTGAAGFIGFHLSKKLCDSGYEVTGIDNLNTYYDVQIKKDRLGQISSPSFQFVKLDLCDYSKLSALFSKEKFDYVINLAAQAGVRYSIENPQAYIDSNIQGFINLLECCRHNDVKHLVYASSSSVYGANTSMPFSVHDNVDHPLSLYAASKKSNELMAHTYSALYKLPTTGLRFFTVYGPWGRPDMALFLFTKAIIDGKPIEIFNNGKHSRDFTYIDDIVEGIVRLIPRIAAPNPVWSSANPDPSSSFAPYRLFNIGNNNPVKLMDFIEAIEKSIGIEAIKNYLPMQPGDVETTYANIDALMDYVDFKPNTNLEKGISAFTSWYLDYNHKSTPKNQKVNKRIIKSTNKHL